MNAAVVLLLCSATLPAVTDFAATDPAASVEAGREALDDYGSDAYPWYDAETDDVRPVELSEPADWSWLWDWLPDWGSFGVVLQWIAWGIVALVLIAVIYLMARAQVRKQDKPKQSEWDYGEDENDAARIEALPFPVRSGRMDLLAEAREQYRQGNFGQAVIYLFSYQLVQLDKHQVIHLTKGKTNRQYLREVGPRPTLRSLLTQTMVSFEDVFFGNHALDRIGFETCWARLDEFQALAKEAAK